MPIAGCDVERCGPSICLNIYVTTSCNQLLRDGRMSILGCDVERCGPSICLNIYVTTSCNQLLRDESMPILGRDVERCGTSQCLRINVTASSDELLRYAPAVESSVLIVAVSPSRAASRNSLPGILLVFFVHLFFGGGQDRARTTNRKQTEDLPEFGLRFITQHFLFSYAIKSHP